MHTESYKEMEKNLEEFLGCNISGKIIADIGSTNMYGTYKSLVESNNTYIGFDLTKGKNVDVVMEEYVVPLKDECIDIVLCGQVLEHCKNPFKLMNAISRIIKKDGWIFLVAPFIWREHRYPVDCFRYLPDGMKSLFDDSGLILKKSYINYFENEHHKKYADCWAIGIK